MTASRRCFTITICFTPPSSTYTTLLTENRLNEHLHNIDEQAHEQLDVLIAQMAKQMSVTEELKTSDPMRWMQMMNNIKASAEEIVLKEVVYK